MPVNNEEPKEFRNDDPSYKDWVARHGGYVLIQRGRSGEYMLHKSQCTHLRTDNLTLKLTRKPRRWAGQQGILVAWSEHETGAKPLLCQSCM
jgi:hypothetical protein